MSGCDFLGQFEHTIALTLLRLEAQAYGVTVRQEIEFRTKRDISIGPVYADYMLLQKSRDCILFQLGFLLQEERAPLPAPCV
jgi:hypothetical protein